MGDVTPIRKRRRYTKKERVTARVTAELSSVAAAARSTGIPATNIRRWRDDPEMAEYGQKTREEIAHEARTLAVKVLAEMRTRLPEFEPRDLSVLYGILIEKSQLLAGEATTRTEHRDVSDNLSDVEREKLSADIEKWLATSDAAESG